MRTDSIPSTHKKPVMLPQNRESEMLICEYWYCHITMQIHCHSNPSTIAWPYNALFSCPRCGQKLRIWCDRRFLPGPQSGQQTEKTESNTKTYNTIMQTAHEATNGRRYVEMIDTKPMKRIMQTAKKRTENLKTIKELKWAILMTGKELVVCY